MCIMDTSATYAMTQGPLLDPNLLALSVTISICAKSATFHVDITTQ